MSYHLIECPECKGTRVISKRGIWKRGIWKCMECRHEWELSKMPTKQIMTRAAVIDLIRNVFGITDTGQGAKWIDFFINAGMLEVKEQSKEAQKLCSYERKDLGLIKVEEWPEGLVLWIGGEIKWRSWENLNDSLNDVRIIKALAKSNISGSVVIMELDRSGFKIVEK